MLERPPPRAQVSKVDNHTFARQLSEEAGYAVGLFGKYLNNWPDVVPLGFDAWLANGGGDYIAPQFRTHGLEWAGIKDGTWQGGQDNYTTAVVGNISIAWIRKVAAEGRPWFAYIAPKSAHEPFIPAPWYLDHWDASWPDHEPRPPSYNSSFEARADHHGNIATNPMLDAEAAAVTTGIFKNRWRTLMSVDDLVASVVGAVDELGALDTTYFFFTSDHGFTLGEFNMLMDKRHPYEFDTRVHLLARGPGIPAGSAWSEPATQVDLYATFVELAGLTPPSTVDGRSLVPLLVRSDDAAPTWRTAVLFEYYYVSYNDKCVANCTQGAACDHCAEYPLADASCTDLPDNAVCWTPQCNQRCYRTEDDRNNYIALRSLGGAHGNLMYAEFQTGDLANAPIEFDAVDFHEHYDMDADRWQMNNTYKELSDAKRSSLSAEVHRWYKCAGATCP